MAGEEYRWLVSWSYADELTAIVQHGSGRGPKLELRVQREQIERPAADGKAVGQRTVVAGRMIGDAILHARALGWRPEDGAAGQDRVLYFWNSFVRDEPWQGRATGAPVEVVRIDPIAELTAGMAGGRPLPEWIRYWSQGGREPLSAAWQVSEDPGVMLDVLRWSGSPGYDAVVAAFAAGAGGPLAQLFGDTGLASDLGELADAAARERAGETGAFYAAMVWLTDVGPAGDWRRFCTGVAGAVRALVPEPPTLAALMAARAAE